LRIKQHLFCRSGLGFLLCGLEADLVGFSLIELFHGDGCGVEQEGYFIGEETADVGAVPDLRKCWRRAGACVINSA